MSDQVDGQGRKDDHGKPALHLLAPDALLGTAEVLAYGAAKYEPRNWERGMDWSRPYGALMRHMLAWWSGEDFDVGEGGSGLSHLDHAACCIHFLQHYDKNDRYEAFDDRPGGNKLFSSHDLDVIKGIVHE